MKVSSFLLALVLTVLTSPVPSKAQTDSAEVGSARKVTSRVLPAYPSIAKNMNLTGSVKLEVVVTPSGGVKSIQVLGGSPVFSQAAEIAVRGWKWEKSEHETNERVEVRFNP